ncbi:hypothetical protein [Paenibacillus kandeliae]|uniref:hypothetical protein n=1 Tax=Paenibacillus kandeliae TaxID=3231269 RepID=UPI003457FD2C
MNAMQLEQLHAQPMIWIESADCFGEEVLHLAKYAAVSHLIERHDFVAYSTVEAIWNQILEYAEQHLIDVHVIEEARHAFNQLMNSWRRLDMNSDSIIYSIIRRISRESNTTAKWIDQSAEKMVTLLQSIAEYNGKRMLIIIEKAEWMDRPSIRLLNRLYKLMPFGEVAFIFRFEHSVPLETELDEPFHIQTSIAVARARIFKRLAAEQLPRIYKSEVSVATYEHCEYETSEYGILADAALALVTQNYENAYLACSSAFQQETISEEAYRICGLVHANLSLYDQAYTLFLKAGDNARSLPIKAHIDCLCALLAVKRFYNLDVANQHYQAALALTDDSDEQNRLERGWVYNGMSFMDTVAASRLSGIDKEKQLESVFYRERMAFQLIKQDNNPGALYLRYNLLSNMTFLLEIKGDYQNALKMWENAFERLIGNQHTFQYRTGMLAWKAGVVDQSFDCLLKAKEIAMEQKDRLDLEGIYEALGYVSYCHEQYEQAFYHYSKGMELSRALAHWPEFRRQAVGYIKSASHLHEGALQMAWETVQAFINDPRMPEEDQKFFSSSITELVTLLPSFVLKMPKSKLSSYHPSVDLEMIPDVDMNDFLVNQDSERELEYMKQKITPVSL